eukprot:5193590-Pyramimonas_sp.AAC.1
MGDMHARLPTKSCRLHACKGENSAGTLGRLDISCCGNLATGPTPALPGITIEARRWLTLGAGCLALASAMNIPHASDIALLALARATIHGIRYQNAFQGPTTARGRAAAGQMPNPP